MWSRWPIAAACSRSLRRELRAHRLERALSSTLSSAREYREQLQNFLEGSADAITHVQEGIIVDANRAWLELFGYSGDDALNGTPLMDLFEQETHPALKGALVACLQGKWTDHGLKVQALLSDGSTLPLELTLTRADYENEPAMRIGIAALQKKDRDLEVQLADAVKNDATTQFLQQRYVIAAMRERCAHRMKGGVRQFAHFKPDRFIDIQHAIGVVASEDFMAQLAELLRLQLTATDLCGRFGGNGFLVMLERGTATDVETWAENVVKRVSDHIFVLEDKTCPPRSRWAWDFCRPPIPTSPPPSPMRSAPRGAGESSAAIRCTSSTRPTRIRACRPTTRSG